jgi:DnaK suppressor protein
VQADPGAELSEGEVRALAERLRALRAGLLPRVQATRSTALADQPVPSEPMDAAEQTREQEDALLAAGREQELLGEIDRALAKLASGRYGTSERSGQPIGFRRLQAIPWARLTIDEAESLLH